MTGLLGSMGVVGVVIFVALVVFSIYYKGFRDGILSEQERFRRYTDERLRAERTR